MVLIQHWFFAYLSNSSTYAWVLTKHALESSVGFQKFNDNNNSNKIHPLNDGYFPPPTPHLKKSAVSFLDALPKLTNGRCEGLFRIRNRSSIASTVSWHCAILQFYLREPCPMFIHSSHFHANRKRNTVNTYIIIYNISQDILPFGFLKRTTVLSVPSDLEGHLSASWPSMKGLVGCDKRLCIWSSMIDLLIIENAIFSYAVLRY